MSANTISLNRNTDQLPQDGRPVWLFGYGSLIYKAGFDYIETRPATIQGWKRRFWQGSHDHRGTPDSPGRVATLIADARACCTGLAYRVTPDVFEQLDVREKNGYLRLIRSLRLDDGSDVEGLVYIATEDNAAWLGPASEAAIARHVAASEGPSGPNSEYVLELAEALRAMGVDDPHVYAIERHLRAVLDGDNKPAYSYSQSPET
ncbi:gamma-glutamylcyclotransferase [Halovibrio salipaludis]|uniref:glutathione-specific gamma-glutamylcyclotransferase n=1 Tax=Halovibrio salipaludis TaxID=2032626 RepID=A0A2A2FC46_9GAMM|nr:gamma-glutamylcyclotransferase [Halovibrio salipaludis]PAU82189.1 gamma-glutamylcyclotransferase [Halovibrio salipaludis]